MNTRISNRSGRAPGPVSVSALTLLCLLAGTDISFAQATQTEQVVVVGERVYPIVDSVRPATEAAVDSAELLRQLPGANLNANGMLTGVAQYRGLFGDRVAVTLDGAGILSGGPNAMDAPLSYASPLLLEHLSLERGIASVSSATESLGGHIAAAQDRGRHSEAGAFTFSGKAQTGIAGNGNLSSSAVQLVGANETHKFALLTQHDDADDFDFADGALRPTRLDRSRYDLSYAVAGDRTDALLYIGRLDTSDTGTPSLPMDIRIIDTNMTGLNVTTEIGSNGSIELLVADTDVEHVMDNFGVRQAPANAAAYRSTLASGDGQRWRLGGQKRFDAGSWRFGIDGETTEHSATITNPNAAAFRIENFNAATRDIAGIYAQWNREVGRLDVEAGLRYNRVDTNAGAVGASIPATNPMMRMMAMNAGMLADAFNASRRDRGFDNVDAVFKLGRSLGGMRNVYVEIARKTRAPSYQELFLWLPLEATGGLADGRSYVGDPGLRSEVSREINVGSNWQGRRAWLAPQIFYKEIADYIQGVPSSDTIANMVATMMTGSGALAFANTDAEIYGLDLAWGYYLSDRLTLSGTLTRARGRRTDIDDDLYRLAPLNGRVALSYENRDWLVRIEAVAYDAQDDVALYNGERRTPGYGIVNAAAQWQLHDNLRLSATVANLFDKAYRDHLDGINRAVNADIGVGERLWGLGRSVQLNLRYTW